MKLGVNWKLETRRVGCTTAIEIIIITIIIIIIIITTTIIIITSNSRGAVDREFVYMSTPINWGTSNVMDF